MPLDNFIEKEIAIRLLINGNRCELSINEHQLRWRPISRDRKSTLDPLNDNFSNEGEKKIKCINLAHIIGVKHCNSSLPSTHCDNKIDNNKREEGNYQQNKAIKRRDQSPSAILKESLHSDKKYKERIKIYYVKQRRGRSFGQLAKLKKLSIEWRAARLSNESKQLYQAKHENYHDHTSQHFQDSINKLTKSSVHEVDIVKLKQSDHQKENSSQPSSCYSSEGYTSSHTHSAESSLAASARTSPTNDFTATHKDNHRRLHLAEEIEYLEMPDVILRKLQLALERQRKERPKHLLIFVNPYGGKGKANQIYKLQVQPLLELAEVNVKLIETKYANHARDIIEDPSFNVEEFEGIVCIGGDGMFSELMNGLLFRYNRDILLKLDQLHQSNCASNGQMTVDTEATDSSIKLEDNFSSNAGAEGQQQLTTETRNSKSETNDEQMEMGRLRAALGGIGQQFLSPPIPLGVIGAGSTDANSFGLIGTNDVITATFNIILGNQIKIDVCSIHSLAEDRLLRFVSTFVAYGYFGDVIRESEKLRWLGPSRYDITGFSTLIKNRTYNGLVRILISKSDGSPQTSSKCSINCPVCQKATQKTLDEKGFELIEKQGQFIGVNAAVTACRCPQTKKGFSPNNHLANGCVDLILVHPCSRVKYVQYLMRTGWTKKSAFDLKYVEAYRCRQFEFVALKKNPKLINDRSLSLLTASSSSTPSIEDQGSNPSSLNSYKQNSELIRKSYSSWNADGEVMNELSVRVKVNSQLLKVFGTGEPP